MNTCLTLGFVTFLGWITGMQCQWHPETPPTPWGFDQFQLDQACFEANETLKFEHEEDKLYLRLGVDQLPRQARGPTHLHFGFSRYQDKYAKGKNKYYGRLYEAALKNLLKRLKLRGRKARKFIYQLKRFGILVYSHLHLACPKQERPLCKPNSQYRTADGSCNNLRKPRAGQAQTPFARFLFPEYDDGVGSPRTLGYHGKPLNSARLISRVVHTADSKTTEAKGITLMFMQWGQFLDHDITRTPMLAGEGSSEIKCCKSDYTINQYELRKSGLTEKQIEERLKHREACFPIQIPQGDQYFKRSCMNFVRSSPSSPAGCSFDFREQQNDITAYIDASNIYGSSDEETRGLRTLHDGLLQSSEVLSGQAYLPKDTSNSSPCVKDMPSHKCFKAGDSRANELVGLVSMHTLWLREHNRISKRLKQLHGKWNDEKLFQETRRIVGAFMQKITYADWLPLLLGGKLMRKHDLKVQRSSRYFYGYKERYDASIKNAFAAAAFRVGHTLVNSFFKRTSKSWNPTGYPPLRVGDHYFNPKALYDKARGGANSILRGLVDSRSQSFDRHISTEVTERLFESIVDGKKEALDLASLNIQRGRDHGLPGYMEFRRLCRLRTSRRISQLPDHDWASKTVLKKVYDHVEDIDLFTGGITEKRIRGALVGPTFGCIIGKQFRNLKFGDRFYFENKPRDLYSYGSAVTVKGFNARELREIRKVTLARILCNNVDVSTMQKDAFRTHTSKRNRRILCSKIPAPDLSVFDSSSSKRVDYTDFWEWFNGGDSYSDWS